jgi:23S rRNA (uridine2552-2'-O)-methyltransferase
MLIVDLGCAPGSWLQYLRGALGPTGFVVGYDLDPVEITAGPNAVAHAIDVLELDADRIRSDIARARGGGTELNRVDALISDMAPKLTGIRDADQARSIGLAEKALDLAVALVRPGGSFVAKLFQGRDSDAFTKRVKDVFSEVRILKPEATREGSREVFVVAKSRRAG